MSKLNIGSTVFNNWKIAEQIGVGAFGNVYKIVREDFGVTYEAALKVINVPRDKSEINSKLAEGMSIEDVREYYRSVVEELTHEISLMNLLKGRTNVVNYEDHLVVESSDSIGWEIYVRMELLTPLMTHACNNKMTRRDVIKLGIDICTALELCQKYNIIHRDIKPENIFVSNDGDYKLGDFGIAKSIEKSMVNLSQKGTPKYMAPEVYKGEKYGFSVDIYSLGIVLYRLLNKNRTPFLPAYPQKITASMDAMAFQRRISGDDLEPPFYNCGRLDEIVLKACAFNPKERYSSPSLMKQELESVQYDDAEAEYIYPNGDEIIVEVNRYFDDDKTDLLFSSSAKEATFLKKDISNVDNDKTEVIFGKRDNFEDNDKTEVIFGKHKVEKDLNIDSVSKDIKKDTVKKKQINKKYIYFALISFIIILTFAGGFYLIKAKTNKYMETIEKADSIYLSNPDEALKLYKDAQELDPKKVEPFISYAYTLLSNHRYGECISYIENDLNMGKSFDEDVQNKLYAFLGEAYFESEKYAQAASYYSLSIDRKNISEDIMLNYAVALGRLGDVNAANDVISQMLSLNISNSTTIDYVCAEIEIANGNYENAEILLVNIDPEDEKMYVRCKKSLISIYQELVNKEIYGENTGVYDPSGKEIDVIQDLLLNHNLGSDATLIETLAEAYYKDYLLNKDNMDSLERSGYYFDLLLRQGTKMEYIFDNLYAIYDALEDYNKAAELLDNYENTYPNYYKPNAFRAILYITLENTKDNQSRNYGAVLKEYNVAKDKIVSSDDSSLYNQLSNLINDLYSKGWLS